MLTDDQRSELRDSSSEYQQSVLDDLFVDESEYRDAVEDWWNCVRETGAEPTEIVTNGNELTFNYSIETATRAEAKAIEQATDSCLSEHYDAIGRVWISQGTGLS